MLDNTSYPSQPAFDENTTTVGDRMGAWGKRTNGRINELIRRKIGVGDGPETDVVSGSI